MRTESTNHAEEINDSFEQQIKLKEIHKALALDCATFFLNESARRVGLNFDLPDSETLIATHALIAHTEWLNDIGHKHLESMADQLAGIEGAIGLLTEAMRDIAESIDSATAKLSTESEE